MSLWSDYIKECALLEIIEDDFGWVTFHAQPEGCLFINDIYVTPEKRAEGHGRSLLERAFEWGRQNKCYFASATIHTSSKMATVALKSALACGFYVAPSGNKDLILIGRQI